MIKRLLLVLVTAVTTNLIQAQNNDYVLFYESFDTNSGTGGNDNRWNGSIASSTIQSDNNGWNFYKGSGAKKCIKLGTETAKGSAETPTIDCSGEITLTFKAAAWNASNEKTGLTITVTNGKASLGNVTLFRGAWSEYAIYITEISGPVNIKFQASSTSVNRFFLDEVKVVKAEKHSISDVKYSTYSNTDYAYLMPDDCEGLAVTYIGADNVFRLVTAYQPGDIVPANEPLVIHSDSPGDKIFMLAETTASPREDNLLVCSKTNPLQDADTKDYYYYALSLNSNGDMESVGFYWIEEGGAPFEIGSSKAYLKLPKSIFTSEEPVKGLAFSEMADGIGSIRHQENNGHIYNLSGQSVLKPISGHIYVSNGKRFIAK